MKISEVDAKVIEAINTAKAHVAQLTGRKPTDINVGLEHGFNNDLRWSISVFEESFHSIMDRGDDLSAVVGGIRNKHAEHLTGIGSSVEQVRRLAEKLGVKVEVLP